ncbi:hypothetical protein [Streptomyces radicis]|nr:hypothetical protein [Streptomyces radicis]
MTRRASFPLCARVLTRGPPGASRGLLECPTGAERDRRLARHRAALEAGADPALVASWSREAQAERLAAETRLKRIKGPTGPARRMSRQEIRDLVDALRRTRPGCLKNKRCWPSPGQHHAWAY